MRIVVETAPVAETGECGLAERHAAPGATELGALYRSQVPRLVRFFARRVGRREDAQDLVQDSFLRLVGRAMPACPEAYLSRIAVNLAHDRAKYAVRHHIDRHQPLDDELPGSGDPHAQLEARDMLMRLERAMLCLKPRTREIFMAHRLDGLSYAEIAARTGLSIKGVEKQMSRAIARLDQLMDR